MEDLRRRSKKFNKREAIAGYLFIPPWIIGFLVFTLGAMVYSLVISFSNYNLGNNTLNAGRDRNYQQLFSDPKVLQARSAIPCSTRSWPCRAR